MKPLVISFMSPPREGRAMPAVYQRKARLSSLVIPGGVCAFFPLHTPAHARGGQS